MLLAMVATAAAAPAVQVGCCSKAAVLRHTHGCPGRSDIKTPALPITMVPGAATYPLQQGACTRAGLFLCIQMLVPCALP
jgi:hypothetical protein